MEYSKDFVTAVVLGKDLVPRQVAPSLHGLGCAVLPSGPYPGGPSFSLRFPPPRGTPEPPPLVSRVRGQGGPGLLRPLPGPASWMGPAELQALLRPPRDPDGPVSLILGLQLPLTPNPPLPGQPWLMFCLAPSPRIGLSQLEGFRRQLLDVLQRSTKPKVSSLPSLPPGHPGL